MGELWECRLERESGVRSYKVLEVMAERMWLWEVQERAGH